MTDQGFEQGNGPQTGPETGPQFAGELEEPRRGQIEIVHLPPSEPGEVHADSDQAPDLFEEEEHPRTVILADLDAQDAPDFIATLESQGIGARLGEATPQGGVQVIIHETNLADAQAVLVEFTGDPGVLDDIGSDDELVPVSAGAVGDLGPQSERLSLAGIDVRMEIPDPDDQELEGTLWVAREDLDEARRILGITT